jgi:hypothetical protein
MTDVDVLPSDTSWLCEPTTGVHSFGRRVIGVREIAGLVMQLLVDEGLWHAVELERSELNAVYPKKNRLLAYPAIVVAIRNDYVRLQREMRFLQPLF